MNTGYKTIVNGVERPYEPDWLVHSVTDLGAGKFYRWRVVGTLLTYDAKRDAIGPRFIWDLPTHPSENWRYVLDNATHHAPSTVDG